MEGNCKTLLSQSLTDLINGNGGLDSSSSHLLSNKRKFSTAFEDKDEMDDSIHRKSTTEGNLNSTSSSLNDVVSKKAKKSEFNGKEKKQREKYVCFLENCNKCYKYLYDFNNHLLSHGLTHYDCRYCSTRFPKYLFLKKHMKTCEKREEKTIIKPKEQCGIADLSLMLKPHEMQFIEPKPQKDKIDSFIHFIEAYKTQDHQPQENMSCLNNICKLNNMRLNTNDKQSLISNQNIFKQMNFIPQNQHTMNSIYNTVTQGLRKEALLSSQPQLSQIVDKEVLNFISFLHEYTTMERLNNGFFNQIMSTPQINDFPSFLKSFSQN